MAQRYTKLLDPVEHLEQCSAAFSNYPRQEWVHHFIHTLEMAPRGWYASMELCQETKEWEKVAQNFTYTFHFIDEKPTFDIVLKTFKEKIFTDIPLEVAYSQPCIGHSNPCCETVQHWVTFYNLSGDPEDDPININIPESEGSREVEGSGISSEQFIKPLKIKNVNIGSEDNPKFANIGDYWDEETISKITDLLHEFQDLFPMKFKEMKGIVGDLGEMKILLKPDAMPVK